VAAWTPFSSPLGATQRVKSFIEQHRDYFRSSFLCWHPNLSQGGPPILTDTA